MSIVSVLAGLVGESMMSALVDEDLVRDGQFGSQAFVDLSGTTPIVMLGEVALDGALDLREIYGGIGQAVEGSNGRDFVNFGGGIKRQSSSHAVSSDLLLQYHSQGKAKRRRVRKMWQCDPSGIDRSVGNIRPEKCRSKVTSRLLRNQTVQIYDVPPTLEDPVDKAYSTQASRSKIASGQSKSAKFSQVSVYSLNSP